MNPPRVSRRSFLGAAGIGGASMLAGCIIPDPPGPPGPSDGSGMILTLRPWSRTIDEVEHDLVIRETVDAVGNDQLRYLSVPPGTLDQRMQLHGGLEAYWDLSPNRSKPWVFHVTPGKAGENPTIQKHGPLDAHKVLDWVGLKPRVQADFREPFDATPYTDVDFHALRPDLTGFLGYDPPGMSALRAATAVNVRSLPGFQPIPKSEWGKWSKRFPIRRMARLIRWICEQVMGSCVGMSCKNCVEAGEYHMFGNFYDREASGMSMYQRIGRSPSSGAYIGDAADEIEERGILPAHGMVDVTGTEYPHTLQVNGGWRDRPSAGWEATAEAWRAATYVCSDAESGARLLYDCWLSYQFGRSRHALRAWRIDEEGYWYENSWGDDWGMFGKSVGKDRRFYGGPVYHPVCRREVQVLVSA